MVAAGRCLDKIAKGARAMHVDGLITAKGNRLSS